MWRSGKPPEGGYRKVLTLKDSNEVFFPDFSAPKNTNFDHCFLETNINSDVVNKSRERVLNDHAINSSITTVRDSDSTCAKLNC